MAASLPYVLSNGIEKSQSDDREFLLHNVSTSNIKVLLVHDPTTDRAAAAMNVHFGYFADPESVPGLAHFLEHMLFLGTTKYPNENEYAQYLSANGGHSNAFTEAEDTTYMFDVKHDALFGALDRFAQFFSAPLFTETATDRELKAVDSEHAKNLNSDGWRLYQLEKSFANPAHPYSKFATGNRDTLEAVPKSRGINVRDLLLEVHKQHYTADRMTLVVVGREPLEKLREWVDSCFAAVPLKRADVAAGRVACPPFLESALGQITYVVPMKDSHLIDVTWPLPPIDWVNDPSAPRYVCHLLGHEGQGSLLSFLKAKGWANGLSAGVSSDQSDYCLLKVSIDCTASGASEHVEDVLAALFAYISELLKSEPERWVFEELKSQSEIEFRFANKPDPFQFVVGACRALRLGFPPSKVLTGRVLLSSESFNPASIQATLRKLTLKNAMVFVAHKEVAKREGLLAERWYGTQYTHGPVLEAAPKDTQGRLHLPPPNPFLPSDFTVAPAVVEGDGARPPSLLPGTPASLSVHYKHDVTYLKPKTAFRAQICSPGAYATIRTSILAELATLVAREVLNEYAYAATCAGLSWSLDNNVRGFSVYVSGFSHKLVELLGRVVQTLTDPKTYEDNEVCERTIDRYEREAANTDLENPYALAMYETSFALNTPRWHIKDKLQSLRHKRVTSRELQNFVRDGDAFRSILRVETLVMGSCSREDALKWSRAVWSKFGVVEPSSAHLDASSRAGRVVALPRTKTVLLDLPARDPNNVNCAIEFVCQLGPISNNEKREAALAGLLIYLAREPCFHRLRTEEQLGYIVDLGGRKDRNVAAMRIVVQSSVKDVVQVRHRIEVFLDHFRRTTLAEMPEEVFASIREACASKREEKDLKLSDEFGRWWAEIDEGSLWWDRAPAVAAEIRRVSKAALVAYWDDRVGRAAPNRRWLISALAAGTGPAAAASGSSEAGDVALRDRGETVSFKDTSPLWGKFGNI